MSEGGDIVRTMQQPISDKQRELAVFQPGKDDRAIVGWLVGTGLADELYN